MSLKSIFIIKTKLPRVKVHAHGMGHDIGDDSKCHSTGHDTRHDISFGMYHDMNDCTGHMFWPSYNPFMSLNKF